MEKRRLERKSFAGEVEVNYSDLDEFGVQFAENISPGGMYLASREPRPVGSILNFRITIEKSGQAIAGKALVVWTKETASGEGAGMGLKFLELEGESEILIRQAINHRSGHQSRQQSGQKKG